MADILVMAIPAEDDDQSGFDDSGADHPVDAVGQEHQIGDLHHDVGCGHLAEVDEDEIAEDHAMADAPGDIVQHRHRHL